ncbi:hypothetical protein FOZ60_004678 [Perkinsus olseni]|uniref:Uncharacterized protein n=1 Tax=Perkinsus olseni TaxID=32597 RepID=A0A7J6NV29_PEROL|nr:hypothetical protein FOZ60_004678 [Perkinsus olseni]
MRPTARHHSLRAAAGAVGQGYADDNDIQQQHWEAKMRVHAKSLVAILVGDGTVPASQELTEAGVWYCSLCEIFLSNLTSVEVQRRRILDHILLDRRHFSLVQYWSSSSLPPPSAQQPHPTTNPLQQDYPLMPSGPSTFYLRFDHSTGDIDIIDSSPARPPRHQEDASWYRTNTRERSSSLRRHIGLTQWSSIDTSDERPRDRSSNGVFATAWEPSTHKWASAGEPSTHKWGSAGEPSTQKWGSAWEPSTRKWVGGSSSENISRPNNIASPTEKAHDSRRGKAPLVLLQQEIDAIPLPPSRQPPPSVDRTPMSSSSTSADGNATAGGSSTPYLKGQYPNRMLASTWN